MSLTRPLDRRRRRRRLLGALLAVSLVAGIAALSVRFESERRQIAEYLDVARPPVTAYRELATDLGAMFLAIETTERQVLSDLLDGAITEADAAHMTLDSLDTPAAAGPFSGSLWVASSSWRAGIGALSTALEVLFDAPEDPEAIALIDAAFVEFRVGDRAYLRFREAVAASEAEVREFPEIRFLPRDTELLYEGESVAQRLARATDLTTRHDVAVSDLRLDPEPVAERDGVAVVPAGGTLVAQATISNAGNRPESAIIVTLLLIRADGAEPPLELQRVVESLDPGAATTLTYEELPVETGRIYEIAVRATVPDDAAPGNDNLSIVFVWSPPS